MVPGTSSISASSSRISSVEASCRPCSSAHSLPTHGDGSSFPCRMRSWPRKLFWARSAVPSVDWSSIKMTAKFLPCRSSPPSVQAIDAASSRAGIRTVTSDRSGSDATSRFSSRSRVLQGFHGKSRMMGQASEPRIMSMELRDNISSAGLASELVQRG